MRAVLAGLVCLLSAVSTFAMWEAVRNGNVASIGPITGLGAAGISALLCISLIPQRWLRVVVALVALGGTLVAAYTLIEPFHRWLDALMGWSR